MSLIRECQVCKQAYKVKPADLRRGWGLTCSKACAGVKRHNSNKWLESNLTINSYKTKNINQAETIQLIKGLQNEIVSTDT